MLIVETELVKIELKADEAELRSLDSYLAIKYLLQEADKKNLRVETSHLVFNLIAAHCNEQIKARQLLQEVQYEIFVILLLLFHTVVSGQNRAVATNQTAESNGQGFRRKNKGASAALW